MKFLMKPAFADDRVNTVLAVILFSVYLGIWCLWLLKLCYYRREKSIKREIQGGIKNSKAERRKKNGRDHGERTGLWKTDAAGMAERFCFATAGIGVLAGLVAFGFAASFLIRPVFVYRYMIPAAGCFWLGFALCLNEILCKPKAAAGTGATAGTVEIELCKLNAGRQTTKERNTGRHNIGSNTFSRTAGIVVAALVVIVGLRDYRAFMGEEEYKIRLMAQTEEALALIGPQDSVVYNFDQVQAVTGYYLPKTTARFLWQAEAERLIQEITSPCGTVETAAGRRKWSVAPGRKERVENSGLLAALTVGTTSWPSGEERDLSWRRQAVFCWNGTGLICIKFRFLTILPYDKRKKEFRSVVGSCETLRKEVLWRN